MAELIPHLNPELPVEIERQVNAGETPAIDHPKIRSVLEKIGVITNVKSEKPARRLLKKALRVVKVRKEFKAALQEIREADEKIEDSLRKEKEYKDVPNKPYTPLKKLEPINEEERKALEAIDSEAGRKFIRNALKISPAKAQDLMQLAALKMIRVFQHYKIKPERIKQFFDGLAGGKKDEELEKIATRSIQNMSVSFHRKNTREEYIPLSEVDLMTSEKPSTRPYKISKEDPHYPKSLEYELSSLENPHAVERLKQIHQIGGNTKHFIYYVLHYGLGHSYPDISKHYGILRSDGTPKVTVRRTTDRYHRALPKELRLTNQSASYSKNRFEEIKKLANQKL